MPSTTIARILVPFDFEAPSYRALDFAKALAEKFGAKIDLLHVVSGVRVAESGMPAPEAMGIALPATLYDAALKEAKVRLDHVAAGVDSKALTAEPRVVAGDVREEILRQAAATHVDVIVMGTHGRHGLDRALLGSVADRITRTATCPVVTVR